MLTLTGQHFQSINRSHLIGHQLPVIASNLIKSIDKNPVNWLCFDAVTLGVTWQQLCRQNIQYHIFAVKIVNDEL